MKTGLRDGAYARIWRRDDGQESRNVVHKKADPMSSSPEMAGRIRVLVVVIVWLIVGARTSATIVTSGDLTGGGTPYNGIDDPWLTTDLVVGLTLPGSLSINGGSDVITNGSWSMIAYFPEASTSSVTVDGVGSTWTSTGQLYVGFHGAGALDITDGGSVSSHFTYIGVDVGGAGEVTVDGTLGSATWTINEGIVVGDYGTGALAITGGGSVTAATNSYVGYNAGGNGTVTVGGGTGAATLTFNDGLYVGFAGVGALDVTGGGSVSVATGTIIGSVATGNGTMNVGGGTGSSSFTEATEIRVGHDGTGELNITGGGSVSSVGTAFIGMNASGHGTVTVGGGTGTATWTTPQNMFVGHGGTGTLDITGGGTVSASDVLVGHNSGSNGSLTIGGGTGESHLISSGALNIGNTGTGTLNITGGGSVSTAAYACIGCNAVSNGTVTVGGGNGASIWTISQNLSVGIGSGSGTLNINAGGVVSAAGLEGGNGSSAINFDGGTLRITDTDTAGNSFVLLSGGGTFDVLDAFNISSAISGAGALTKTGSGSLELSGTSPNTYTGTTTVDSGTLVLNKPAGGPSNNWGTSIQGPLVINAGATVRLNSNSQIADSQPVTINGGAFDLGGHDETVNSVTFIDGGQVTGGTSIGLNSADGVTTTGNGSAAFTGLYLKPGAPADANPRKFTIGATAPLTVGSISNGFSVGAIEKLGPGTLTLTGASTYSGETTVNDGTLRVSGSGSITNSPSMNVNNGMLHITGGGSVSSGAAHIGYNVGSTTGMLTVEGSGSQLTLQRRLNIGLYGTGILNITDGGSVHTNQDSWILSNSTANIGGGANISTWTSNGTLHVVGGAPDAPGTASLTITGGGSVSSSYAEIDGSSPSTPSDGTVSVGGGAGSATLAIALVLAIGDQGTGTLHITGGGSVTSAGTYIAYNAGSNGTATVGGGTGTAAWSGGSIEIGRQGAGILNIVGGGDVFNSTATIGSSSGGSGVVTVGGGGMGNANWTISSFLNVGANGGTGILNINAGGLVTTAVLGGGNANSAVNFDGGTLRITFSDVATNTINLLSGGGTIDVPNPGTTFDLSGSGISGPGGLTKTGSGWLALHGANTYNGPTVVDGGTLAVTYSLAGGVEVNENGTLQATGSIGGNLSSRGVVRATPGALNAAGDFTQFDTGMLEINLYGTAPGVSYNQLLVNGAVTLDGTLNISLSNGFVPTSGMLFDILDWNTLGGTFDSITLPALTSSLSWNTSQLYVTGALSVGQPGDFSGDGVVDAADYVVYRKGLGTIYSSTDFDVWREHFGESSTGGGGYLDSSPARVNVPEPECAVLGLCMSLIAVHRRGLTCKKVCP
jgi:T5SS/PEP-CTERM-associated repeat protein/autotransporter-associated beta strand protein